MSEQQQAKKPDYRMWLNNYAGRHKLGTVEYVDEEIKEGSQRIWKSTVQINGTDVGSGESSKKAEAKEMAAKKALVNLGVYL
ncbi:hypothetical protein F5887DRAFT_987281 [Amanita rubescens]|nr:hypothetical protein F5887DRAFT_1025008 [Amanita rubescens]KAF8325943.1 hypothetical protein F5887DRAFT_1016325 [Amanita rubescens]KAF8336675.1 hypothetical protein F5887DRAFT_987281 [Amanita rubescens]